MKFVSLILLLVPVVESRKFKSKDGRCPARKSQDSVPDAPYPSRKRRRKLGKVFELDIINRVTYSTTFDDKSEAGSYLHVGGRFTDGVNYFYDALELDGCNLKSPFEAHVVCASKCEAVDCDYFSVSSGFTAEKSPNYSCQFLKNDALTAKTENFYPAFIPLTLAVSNKDIVLRKSTNVTLPLFKDTVGCNTPIEKDLQEAIGCGFKYDYLGEPEKAYCDQYLTDEFLRYVFPAAECIGPAGLEKCLQCISAAFSTVSCGGDICEEDDNLNMITATPCGEKAEGTDGCVNNACGDVCLSAAGIRPGDDGGCKAQIQSSVLCSNGNVLKKGATGIVGSCINANFPEGPKILVEDFSCAFVKD